jgi:hypothetical protein
MEKLLLLIELRILEVGWICKSTKENAGILPSGGAGHELIQRIELLEQVLLADR